MEQMGQIIKTSALLCLLTFSSFAAPEKVFAPAATISIKNSQNLYNIVSKNKWFLEFRQSPLYYGMLYDLYPTLFSLPEEFTSNKESTWTGRLVDYVYESILKNRSTQIFYYQQNRLVSPWGFSVNGLTSSESKVIDQLIKLFKVGDEKEIELSDTVKGKVSLIEIKSQKWAVKKEGSCFAIAKDPKIALSIGSHCKSIKFTSDLDMDLNLSLMLPSLMMVREKVVGISETMKIPFLWNEKDSKFEIAPINVGLTKDNIIVSKKIANELLKVVPADSHFFVTGNIKIWNGNMNIDNVKGFLSSKARSKAFQKQAAAVLVQVPVKSENLVSTENALILEMSSINQAQLDNVGQVFESSFGEVFIRPVCSKSLVISRSKELLQKIQNVCDRKSPSILDKGELNAGALSTQDNSMSLFADIGKWMSTKIESGYLSKAKQKKQSTSLPEELLKSQRLLEQLPKYMVKGSIKDQNIVLK